VPTHRTPRRIAKRQKGRSYQGGLFIYRNGHSCCCVAVAGPMCTASLATVGLCYERAHDFEISIRNSWSADPHSPRCGSACGRRRKPGDRATTCRALVCCLPLSLAHSTRGKCGRPAIRSNWGATGIQCRAASVLLAGATSKNAQHVPYTPGGKRPGRIYCEGWSTAVNYGRGPCALGHSGRPFSLGTPAQWADWTISRASLPPAFCSPAIAPAWSHGARLGLSFRLVFPPP
jgi:hypothetical protein